MISPLLQKALTLRAVSACFQPIYDVRGQQPILAAVEGLLRGPRGSNLEAPDLLFEFARLKRAEGEADRIAVQRILAEFRRLSPPFPRLHINVHASTLARDDGFAGFLIDAALDAGLVPNALTLELVEQADIMDEEGFVAALGRLREAGVAIALDDVGVGTSNYRMMLVARPTMMKVDRYLVDGIAGDPMRRAVIGSISMIAAELGACVVAEGVESPADLRALRDLGIGLVQGFLLCRPLPLEELRPMLAGPARQRAVNASKPPVNGRSTGLLRVVGGGVSAIDAHLQRSGPRTRPSPQPAAQAGI